MLVCLFLDRDERRKKNVARIEFNGPGQITAIQFFLCKDLKIIIKQSKRFRTPSRGHSERLNRVSQRQTHLISPW